MNALYAVVRVLGYPRKLLYEYWAITSSQTYILKELNWLQHASKKTSKL